MENSNNKHILEYLSYFRKEYLAVKSANHQYEIAIEQMKQTYLNLKQRSTDVIQNLLAKKQLIKEKLQQERLQFESQKKCLDEQIRALITESNEHFAIKDKLNAVIKNQENKISELQHELEHLQLKIAEYEEKLKLQNEDMQKILNSQAETPALPSFSKSNDNSEQDQKEEYIEKKMYFERLKYLEKIHKEDIEKRDQENERLRNLLKQPKRKTYSKSKAEANINVFSRYPDLSEFINKTKESVEQKKKRKLYTSNEEMIDI